MSIPDARKAPWHRFGERLKAARLRARLTQQEVVRRCGKKGNSWLVALESGQNQFPRDWALVDQLAEILGVTTEWLVFGRDLSAPETSVCALGVGGPDVSVPAALDRDALLALWPGHWTGGVGAPPAHTIVVISADFRDGTGWVVWRERSAYRVAGGRFEHGQAYAAAARDEFALVEAVGRVLVVIDPTT